SLMTFFFIPFCFGKSKKETSPPHILCIHKITSSFIKEVEKKYKFGCIMSGGSMPYDIAEVLLHFDTYQSASIEQAREWEVRLTERLAEMINQNEEIRPYLREYPFPASRIDIMLSFNTPKNSSPSKSLQLVFHSKNRILYSAKDPNNDCIYYSLKEEPYEEARKIVFGNDSVSATPLIKP
ncbi:MAG: hypothetical protein K2X08_03520, partial [Chlamydiales bacterium]|nr:hypothetical protein [Chlamydiales bacterium]